MATVPAAPNIRAETVRTGINILLRSFTESLLKMIWCGGSSIAASSGFGTRFLRPAYRLGGGEGPDSPTPSPIIAP